MSKKHGKSVSLVKMPLSKDSDNLYYINGGNLKKSTNGVMARVSKKDTKSVIYEQDTDYIGTEQAGGFGSLLNVDNFFEEMRICDT